MRIEVEPQQLIGAGKHVGSLGTQLGALSDAMGQVLAGGIASGSDPAGLNFGITYGRQADEFGQALADAANAFKNVGLMLEATGFNYRNADAASTPGGPGPSGGISGEQARTTAGDAPYGPNGSNVPPPGKWWLITPFLRMIPGIGIAAGVAMTWPSGNAAMMNLTAAQWRNIGQGLSVFEGAMAGAKASVDAQDIPEKGTIKTALEELGTRVSDLSKFAGGLATTIGEFATGVQETQDAIRNLLNRISLDGLWDTVTGFLSGDGDRVLREIADDVSTVLENFQNQVKGVMGLLEELKTLLGEAADAFQKWIRPVLVETFGDQVGNRLADGIKLYTDIQVGAASGLINLVSGTVAMADPDTWKGLADTAMMLIDDPSKTDDVLKEIGSQFIALEQWQGDNPGRGFGEAAFNIGSLFVPGGALAKGGSVAKGLSATRHLLDKIDSGSPSRLPGLGGNRVPDMGELPEAPGAPDVPEFDRPGIPESVLAPGGSGAPMRPQSVDPGAGSPSSASPGSGAGGGHAPTGDSPNGSGPGSSSGAPVPAGVAAGAGDGPGGSSSGGSGSGSSSGAPVPAGVAAGAGDGSSGSSSGGSGSGGGPSGNGDGPGSSSSGGSGSGRDTDQPVAPPASPSADAPGTGSGDGSGGPSNSEPGASTSDRPPAAESSPLSAESSDHVADSSQTVDAGTQDQLSDQDANDHAVTESTESHGAPTSQVPERVPGVDFALPAEDAMQVLSDPAAEIRRLSEGGIPDSVLEGYDPLAGRQLADFRDEFTVLDKNGNLAWDWQNQAPNNGFDGEPVELDNIPSGHQLDRLGFNGGGFMADEGAPMAERAMAPGPAAQYHTFEGTGRPVPEGKDWVVQHGPVKSAFGQPGGAEQWVVIDRSTGYPVKVEDLIRARMLRETTP
ncbi:TNT domain-containing protein [Mycobacterium sp. AMU20-3851]|uniref:glycohydrolase toxin TNT-related protein n=1 Tax=Mycobacterium sp. AMU20-3851 TaxID=3122055 RepID=UPI003754804A